MKPFSFFALCSPCSSNDDDHKQRFQPANKALTSIHYQQEVMKLQSQGELNNTSRKLGSLCITLTEKQFDQTKYDVKFSCKSDIEQKQILSKMIAKYIGKRVQKYENIIEVNSSINQYSIEFARNGSFVIAISSDYTTMQIGFDNIRINKYIPQIQQIYGRFLDIKLNGIFDLIFINLTDELDISNEILLNQLIKAFKMSKNIIVFTTNEIYEAQIFNIINHIFKIDSNIMQIYYKITLLQIAYGNRIRKVIFKQIASVITHFIILEFISINKSLVIVSWKPRFKISHNIWPIPISRIFCQRVDKENLINLIKFYLNTNFVPFFNIYII